MDCVTCGRELIGYNFERTAAICSENHLVCNKCNNKNAHVCPFCDEKTLYCDILRCDYQSIILLIDMQRQYPQKRKSVHPIGDHETEFLDAEDEVIEECVVEEEEEPIYIEDVEEWLEEDSDATSAGDNDETDESGHPIKCVDSVLVGKLKAKKKHEFCNKEDVLSDNENFIKTEERVESARDGSVSDYFDFRSEKMDNVDTSRSPTPSWAAMSTEEELQAEPTSSRYLQCHTSPATRLQSKVKDKSLCAQVFAYNLTVNTARPQQNMKYVPLGDNKNKLPTHTSKAEDEHETSPGEEEEEEEGDDDCENRSHCLQRGSSLLFSESNRIPKNMPMIDFTTRFYHTTNKRLNRWHNVNKNPDNVLYLDDEQLFVWRNVRQAGKDFQSLFVVTAPKGDKRMLDLLKKLQTSNDANIYANSESNYTSESDT